MSDIHQKASEINTDFKNIQNLNNTNNVIQETPNVNTKADRSAKMAARRKEMEKKFGKGVAEGTHKMVGINEEEFKKRQEIIDRKSEESYKKFFILNMPAPVPGFKDVQVISPSFLDVVKKGEDMFSSFTIPFTVTIDSLFFNSENYHEIANKFSIFDVFYGEDESLRKLVSQICGGDPFQITKNVLETFCPGCEIQFLGSAAEITGSGKKKLIIIPKGKSIKDAIVFDRKFYDAFRKVIQDATKTKDAKKPRKDRGMSEYIKENNRLMNQKEAYERKKNATELAGMINVVSHGGSSYIPYGEIATWNWFQFLTAYETISERIGYDSMIGYKLSANFQVKDEVKHWLPAASLQKKEEDKKPVL